MMINDCTIIIKIIDNNIKKIAIIQIFYKNIILILMGNIIGHNDTDIIIRVALSGRQYINRQLTQGVALGWVM